MTPLKLALQKCCDCINNPSMDSYFEIAEILMKSDEVVTGADASVLGLAINFPVFLKGILTSHPEFYQCGDNKLSPLTEAIRSPGLVKKYKKMGFFELMLQQNADSIVMELITYNQNYVTTYLNENNETPLHTAAKLGNHKVAKRLMESRLVSLKCV